MLTIGDILATLTGYQATGDELTINQVVIDSRLAQAGSLFVAFDGNQVDGHQFVADAFSRGAFVALVSKQIDGYESVVVGEAIALPIPAIPFCIQVKDTEKGLQQIAAFWRQKFSLQVVGITGSVGKTSTKELTHAVLAQKYETLKSIGNFNNEIGLPLSLLQLNETHQYAVLEMGMYRLGEIKLLAELAKPEIGVITTIGSVHLSRVGSQEGIVQAKRELVESLPEHGFAILNFDDPLVMGMAPYTKAKIFSYGLEEGADLRAIDIESMGLEGVRFSFVYQNEQWPAHVPLLGRHSVHTALRAAAVGLIAGLSWEEILLGLQGMSSQLRLVVIPGPKQSMIIDDTYNSTPESAIAALNLLADLEGRRIAVLGDMLELGHVAKSAHELVGRRAMDVADILVGVGELGRWISDIALAEGMESDSVHWVANVVEATELLESLIEEKDVILIKGSHGLRLDQIVAQIGRGE